jgi:hypothetical protein
LHRGELDRTASTSETALYSPEDPEYAYATGVARHRSVLESAAEPEDPEYGDATHSIKGHDLVCDPEQLEYQYRPITPGEEKIIRIYEDKIYPPPDMTEKPREVCRQKDPVLDPGEAALYRQLFINQL